MKNKAPYIALIVALVALAFVVLRPVSTANGVESKHDAAYDRVIKTNTLRCGYGIYAPYFTKDAATGQLGGIWHDFTEAIGQHLGIKIEWAEEVGLGDIGAALDAGKIDVYCGGLWTAGKRERTVDFLNPSAYEPVLVYVRMDDHRFDNDLTAINDPKVRISTIDGEGGGLVAQEEFPKAQMVSLPQLSGYADMFNQVVEGKADILLSAPSGAEEFMKNNQGVLRPITDKPVRIFPIAFAVKYGENSLRDILNQAQEDIIADGTMEKILKASEPFPNAFIRVVPSYLKQGKE